MLWTMCTGAPVVAASHSAGRQASEDDGAPLGSVYGPGPSPAMTSMSASTKSGGRRSPNATTTSIPCAASSIERTAWRTT